MGRLNLASTVEKTVDQHTHFVEFALANFDIARHQIASHPGLQADDVLDPIGEGRGVILLFRDVVFCTGDVQLHQIALCLHDDFAELQRGLLQRKVDGDGTVDIDLDVGFDFRAIADHARFESVKTRRNIQNDELTAGVGGRPHGGPADDDIGTG